MAKPEKVFKIAQRILVQSERILDAELNLTTMDERLPRDGEATIQGNITAALHRAGTGVHVLIGEGATLAGIASYFTEHWIQVANASGQAHTARDYEAIGLELFRFATEVAFGSAREPSEANIAELWWTGTLFPLPALMVKTDDGLKWHVDDAVLGHAASAPQPLEYSGRLGAVSFTSFNPYDVAHAAEDVETYRDRLARDFSTSAILDWRNRLRWNPYAAAIPLVHLMSALDSARRAALIHTLFEQNGNLSASELARIRRTTGGAIVLRVAHLLLADGASAARQRVADALGVAASSNLRARTVDLGIEPPLPASANVKPAEQRRKDEKYTRTFMGRSVARKWAVYEGWSGPSAAGSITPDKYFDVSGWPQAPTLNERQALLKEVKDGNGNELNPRQIADRLIVCKGIFKTEGYCDAIRAADKALISVGMQQFSFHVEEEGTVLFHRVRNLSEIWFDVFIRSAGYDVATAPADASFEILNNTYASTKPRSFEPPTLPRPNPPATDARPLAEQLNEKAWLIKLGSEETKRQWCVPGTAWTLTSQQAKVEIKNGSPAVITWPAHRLRVGSQVTFSAEKLPDGLAAKKTYYVVSVSEISFQVAQAEGGPPVATTGTPKSKVTCSFSPRSSYGVPYVAGEPGEAHTDCRKAFGYGQSMRAGDVAEDLLTRWALAATLVPEFVQAQMEVGVFRFARLRRKVAEDWEALFEGMPAVTLQKLFGSVAHAAALVDCFINTPETALPAARRAYGRVQAPGAALPDFNQSDFRLRTLLAFLSERWYTLRTDLAQGGKDKAAGAANSVAPPRVAVILDDLLLDPSHPPAITKADGLRGLRWTDEFHW